MKIYGLIRDCGDGSSCVDFYKNIDTVNKLMEEDPESYYANEESPAVTLNLPDDIDLKEVGITLEDDEYRKVPDENIFDNDDDLLNFLIDANVQKEYIFEYNNVKYKLEKRLSFLMDYGRDTYWQTCNFKGLYDNGLITEINDTLEDGE